MSVALQIHHIVILAVGVVAVALTAFFAGQSRGARRFAEDDLRVSKLLDDGRQKNHKSVVDWHYLLIKRERGLNWRERQLAAREEALVTSPPQLSLVDGAEVG